MFTYAKEDMVVTLFDCQLRVQMSSVFGIVLKTFFLRHRVFSVLGTKDNAHQVLLQCEGDKRWQPATLFCDCTFDFCVFRLLLLSAPFFLCAFVHHHLRTGKECFRTCCMHRYSHACEREVFWDCTIDFVFSLLVFRSASFFLCTFVHHHTRKGKECFTPCFMVMNASMSSIIQGNPDRVQ